MEEIVNKVALSGLITLDLEELCDVETERKELDLTPFLFQGLILREKEFRNQIKETDFSPYAGRHVYITTPKDALVPTWAYMVIVTLLEPVAKTIHVGEREMLDLGIFRKNLDAIDIEQFRDAKVVVKGCGKFPVPSSCYAEVTRRLVRVSASIMYGEPCSTVPVFKKKKN